jgi:antitoxin component YwqK of YwqJK toxin-antitoxin module
MEYISYHDSSNLALTCNEKYSKTITARGWTESGALDFIACYLDGKYVQTLRFYPTGVLKSIDSYSDNHYDGSLYVSAINFRANGTFESEESCSAETTIKRSGDLEIIKSISRVSYIKRWAETGIIQEEGPIKDDKPIGEWNYYDAQGRLLRTENFGN